MQAVHGDLGDIRGCALYRRVDRLPFERLALVERQTILQLAKVTLAPQERLNIAIGVSLLNRIVDVLAHLRIGGKVLIQERLRFSRPHLRAAAEAERADAVDRSEVDHLAQGALLIGYLVKRRIEEAGSGYRMNILPLPESFQQWLLPHDIRQNA